MFHLLIALYIFKVLPVAVPLSFCDPLTQYENELGECCKMCGPGTRMYSSNCQDPLCEPCKDDEYQTGYTTKKICDLHDYCDNNKNKESIGRSKTSKGICRCKTGYHCADIDDCITCDPHTICNPGYRIQFRGNHSHDTVCQKCPPDTFSNGTSEKCDCGPGRRARTKGTPSSDTICEEDTTDQQQAKWIVPLILGILAFVLIVIVIVIYNTSAKAKAKVKGCVESCWHGASKPEAESPEDQHSVVESEEQRPRQEETNKEPEENIDDQHLCQPLIDLSMTENGNTIAQAVQEDGKEAPMSRQESQE